MKDARYNIEVNGKEYTLTGDGQLLDMESWDSNILNWFAEKAEISLQDEHHTAIEFIRETYRQRQRHPVVRNVAAHLALKHGEEKGTPKFFYSLFPQGVNQATQFAGIPKKELCF